MTSQPMNTSTRLIIALLVIMGVLIVVGFVVVGVEVARRASQKAGEIAENFNREQETKAVIEVVDAPPPASVPVTEPLLSELPRGAVIREIETEAGRLVVWLRIPGEGDQLRIIDLKTGALIAQISAAARAERQQERE
jgi:hypothetical protein